MKTYYSYIKGRLSLCAFVCFLFWPLSHSAAEPVTLVDDGRPASSIVLPKRPTRAAQFAAFELKHIIKLITGAELPIVIEGDAFTGVPIRVGSRDIGRNPEKFLRPEEYQVSVTPQEILLSGMDEPDFGKVDYENPKTFPSCSYTRKATTYAVYEFLERSCNVRFYSFGDDGISYFPNKKLDVYPMYVKRVPAMASCRWPEFSNLPKNVSTRDRALLEARWRKSAINGHVNHNIWSIYFRYWNRATGNFYGSLPELFQEKRPAYFARGYTGKSHLCAVANKFPGDLDLPPQLCYSNQGPVTYFAHEAAEVFRGKKVQGARIQPPRISGTEYYYPVMEDDNKYWCLCGECTALFQQLPQEERGGYIHFDWINRIARKAAEQDPQIGIITCAYSNSLPYPDKNVLKLEPNVAVRLCLAIDSWYHPGIYEWQHSIYKQWVKNEAKKRQLSVWCYLLSPGFEARQFYRYGNFIPLFYPWKAGEFFLEFVRDGIQGYFAEIDMNTQFLEAYLINRIAWEGPDADPAKIIDEYFRRYYGAAGKTMEEFYRQMEQITFQAASYPKETMKEFRKTSFAGGVIHTERVNLNLLNENSLQKLNTLILESQKNADTPQAERRVNDFAARIWKTALDGRKSFMERELLRKTPPPVIRVTKIADAGGNPDVMDFSGASPLAVGYTSSGIPVKNKRTMYLLHDDKFLYLRYFESDPPAIGNGRENFWLNNIEIFAGYQQSYPVSHFAATPDGSLESLVHEIEGGVPRLSNRKIDIRLKNDLTGKEWQVTMAIPLKTLLPDRSLCAGKRFFLNLMRTCRFPDGISSSWSVLGGNGSYIQSLDRMGKVYLAE